MKTTTTIQTLLDEATASFCFSGYQLYAEQRGNSIQLQGGRTSYWGNQRPVTPDTLFDIGSLTKVVVTTSLLALGVDRGEIDLDDFIASRVAEFRGTPFHHITIGDLLQHAAGLKPWVLLDATAEKSMVTWLCKKGRELFQSEYREKAVYSDLDFFLLGTIVIRLWGDLRKVFEERVGRPLRMRQVQYGPVSPAVSAATEFSSVDKTLLHGVVFDENTRILKGVSAHAGLFATTLGLAPFCREWLRAVKGQSSWLSQGVARRFTTATETIKGSSWAYGWDTRSPAYSSAGDLFSLKSFGHLGYTGTSIWIDPENELFAIFLSNRVHPSRVDERIKKLRPLLHNEICKAFR